MEYFDILRRDGSKIGKTALKGTGLSGDNYYMGVHGYIHNENNEFLLQQRSGNKDFLPFGWDIHMGHVEAGETCIEAIKREIKEEIGIEISNTKYHDRFIWDEHNHMIDVFMIVEHVDISQATLKSDEVINLKYVSKDEMIDIVNGMNYRPSDYRKSILDYISNL